jgi:urease accessory protein
MTVRAQTPPLKVVRAFPQDDGAALVHLHNVSGGVLAGDELVLSVHVHPHAHARLTTTGATRLYRRRPAGRAVMRTHAVVSSDALLEYLPDQIIPFRHANVLQSTHIDLTHDAGVLWWEIVAPGREAMGERFAYDALEMEMRIDVDGMPIARERMRWNPLEHALHAPARMGGFGYYASFYACRVGADVEMLEETLADHAQRCTRIGEVSWGASALAAHGVVVRGLAHTARALQKDLWDFWSIAGKTLYGRSTSAPRKIY